MVEIKVDPHGLEGRGSTNSQNAANMQLTGKRYRRRVKGTAYHWLLLNLHIKKEIAGRRERKVAKGVAELRTSRPARRVPRLPGPPSSVTPTGDTVHGHFTLKSFLRLLGNKCLLQGIFL